MSNHPDPKQDQSKAMGGTQPGAYPMDQYTASPAQQGGGGEKSPYYTSSAPSISLPKGGGALKGIDEKFTVNAVNGTASLQIPFPLTPGRGGFTPSLSVDYNSGSGNSEFGLGWTLSLPSIQRRTNKKLPLYNDAEESDVFLLAGAEDMVPKLIYNTTTHTWDRDQDIGFVIGSETYDIKRYRPRIEGLFAKIEHITERNTRGSWWKVTTKDNVVTFYGLSTDCRLSDPENEERIFKWMPQISFDNKGNVMCYYYNAENNYFVELCPHESNRLNGNAPFTNIYLKGAVYCNKIPFLVSDIYQYDVSPILPDIRRDFLMEVVLDYGGHDLLTPFPIPEGDWFVRKDPFSDFHAGFEIRTYRRCNRVLMFHYFDELASGEPVLVRSLDFNYFFDTLRGEDPEVDYITAFTQSGYIINPDGGYPAGGYIKKTLPPVTLTHIPSGWDTTIHNVSRADAENAPQGLTGGYQWIDLWGEGLPGILNEQGHGWFYKENLGDGHFAPAMQIAPKPSLQGLGQGLQWHDLQADGRRQLVSTAPGMAGYYQLNDDQHWETFRSFKDWINVDWQSPFTHMLDLDGDGRADLLVTEDRVWRWYENEGTEGYTIGGEASFAYDEERKPRLLHNDMVQSIFLADINGDGLTDIVRIQNGSVCYWPNLGYGRFGAKVTMSNAPFFDRPELFNPMYITLADITGTGAPDLIYLGQNKCSAWINFSGNSWSEKKTEIVLPEISPETKIAILDFLGNGTACIVWSSPLPQHAHAPMRYIDLMGGNKPYLMATYANGMGKTVTVTYKQSTKYFLEDKQAGRPWATNLPFPVHCIAEISTTDAVSQTTYTQLYSYHHGYYDHEEREFRGFGRVETIDTDRAKAYDLAHPATERDLDQFPVLTKTWHHTGAWMRERTLLEAFADEYYHTTWAELPIVPDLPAGLTRQEQREAYRALKGQPLRQEVYALDGAVSFGLADIPYTVSTHSYAVMQVQPQAGNLYGAFLSYQQQSLDWSAERDISDPRVAHQLTLAVDELGNVLESATVSYPRDPAAITATLAAIAAMVPAGAPAIPTADLAQVRTVQSRMLATYSANVFTTDAITTSGGYHLRVPCEARTYEVTNLSLAPTARLWTPATLYEQIHGSAPGAIPVVHPATQKEYADTTPTSGVTIRELSFKRTLFLDDRITGPLFFGTIEPLAIPFTQYELAFTDGILNGTDYYAGSHVTPAMLADGGYVNEASLAAYGFRPTGTNRYWIPGGLVDYDGGNFYTPSRFQDPFGNTTIVNLWGSYYLLPKSTTDALGNTTTVDRYNWYNLQPEKVTDINGNQREILYDALGLPVAEAVMGKAAGPVEGDNLTGLDPNADAADQAMFFNNPAGPATARLLGGASWRCVYDLHTIPVAVGMIAREVHAADDTHPYSTPMLVRFTFTDGFGRTAMNKVQAAPAEGHPPDAIRWIGNGKVIYNNKGNAVMQYEPYFVDPANPRPHAFDYTDYAATYGVSPRMYFDALGRNYQTDLPDGSYTKMEWDSWQQVMYDNNDTLSTSNPWYVAAMASGDTGRVNAANKAFNHADTPTTTLLDTLGRPFCNIDQNRVVISGAWVTLSPYLSFTDLEITGNRLSIRDARGLTCQQYWHNMLKTPIVQLSGDSGAHYLYLAADGKICYDSDAVNSWSGAHYFYDVLRRLSRKEMGSGAGFRQVKEVYEYDDLSATAASFNLKGKPNKIYDGAGVTEIPHYDFKGNPLRAIRTFTANPTQRPDWMALITSGALPPFFLEPTNYITETAYDALSRPTKTTAPGTNGGITLTTYDRSGLLFSTSVENVHGLTTGIIDGIHYNAKGQRITAYFHNGATTSYTYDPQTFRVKNICTTRGASATKLQDLHYWYDPAGNITLQTDGALQTVFFNNAIVSPDNDYTYDALYRLIIARGREHAVPTNPPDYKDSSRSKFTSMAYPNNPNELLTYIEYYTYDQVGNVLAVKHTAGTGAFPIYWTRTNTISGANNRLLSTVVGSTTETYNYDPRGNMAGGMNHLNAGGNSMHYNPEDRLESVIVNANVTTYYQYDSGGQRVRKTVIDNSTTGLTKIRKYVGHWEEYSEGATGASATLVRETLHINDTANRIALIDTEITGSTQALRYQFSNQISTATLELDENANVITYEEYYPFGSTSFQSGRTGAEVNLKRYRYTGKERDEETGLYYHGARYYCPWLSIWMAPEPINNEWYNHAHGAGNRNQKRNFAELGNSDYTYCNENPIIYNDPNGEFRMSLEDQLNYPGIWDYIYDKYNGIFQVTKSERRMEILKEYGRATMDEILRDFTPGQGPIITPYQFTYTGTFGHRNYGQLLIAKEYFEYYKSATSDLDRSAALHSIVFGIIHEEAHQLDAKGLPPNEEGPNTPTINAGINFANDPRLSYANSPAIRLILAKKIIENPNVVFQDKDHIVVAPPGYQRSETSYKSANNTSSKKSSNSGYGNPNAPDNSTPNYPPHQPSKKEKRHNKKYEKKFFQQKKH